MITGLDLVSLGIMVSAGAELPISQDQVVFSGHAIQARINAENPFSLEPSPGKLWEYHWPGGARSQGRIPRFFWIRHARRLRLITGKGDRMAPTEEQAIARLDSALDETILIGLDTLIPLHKAILAEKNFLERNITIDYLTEHHESLLGGK